LNYLCAEPKARHAAYFTQYIYALNLATALCTPLTVSTAVLISILSGWAHFWRPSIYHFLCF